MDNLKRYARVEATCEDTMIIRKGLKYNSPSEIDSMQQLKDKYLPKGKLKPTKGISLS
jgi:hypothetical protein